MKKVLAILLLSLSASLFTLCSAQYDTLFSFNYADGGTPYASLALSGNVLYGMTPPDGPYRGGVVFSIHTNGTGFKDLIAFNGAYPGGSLTISGHLLYGMTSEGGTNNFGVIFHTDTNGNGYTILHNFDYPTGGKPYGDLTLSGSVFYGMTYSGGANDSGVIFSIDTNGSAYTVLHNFVDSTGVGPIGSLALLGNTLYGMTHSGGKNGPRGVIFSIGTNGNGYTVLHSFNNSTGELPNGSLTLAGNKLYGMTIYGGTNNDGVLFSINTNGTGYTDLVNFNGANGEWPFGNLTLSGKVLYGMTTWGGNNNQGLIFSVDTNGSRYTYRHNFSSPTGDFPEGSLIISGNMLYGMTSGGGIGKNGVIFKMDTATIDSSTLSVKEIMTNNNALIIYPNPSNGNFTISFSHPELVSGSQTVEIYNMLGEKVYSNQFNTQHSTFNINMSNQSDGVYLYRVITENGGLVGEGKVVIQK